MKATLPTINESVERVLAEVDGPIEVNEFYKKVLKIRPSSAKNPTSSIRNNLKMNQEGKSIVFLDRKTIIPLRVALPGIRFRIPLSSEEVTEGVLMFMPSFQGWANYHDNPETFELVDEQGRPLPTNIVSLRRSVAGLLGDFEVTDRAFELANWLRAHRAHGNDSILVTIESWEPKHFRLEFEPARERRSHRGEIALKNKELADTLFDMLEAEVHEYIYPKSAIPTAYLRLSEPKGYPGDHWIDVIEKDLRMKLSDIHITYSENRNLLESIFAEEEPAAFEQEFTPQQGKPVYRFKAALKYRKGLWRCIEIQGKHTLADFDDILRDAFGHDSMDHLGGFWKLVPRGKGRRFRELDLGDVDPFGEGDGADLRIAGLELQVGDRLKYVYDFGDWIEHEITLEAIDPPKARVRYPRISAQNKPRYRYCEHCKKEEKKTVATYICIECSNDEQRQILICEDCLDAYHEEHYADEIVY